MGSKPRSGRVDIFSRMGILAKLLLLGAVTLIAFVWLFFVTGQSFDQLSKSVTEIQALQGGVVRRAADLQAKASDAQLMLYRAAMGAIGTRAKADIGALTSMAGTVESGQAIISSILSSGGASAVDPGLIDSVIKTYGAYAELLGTAGNRLAEGRSEAQAFLSEADAAYWLLKGSSDKFQKALRDSGNRSVASAVTLSLDSSLKVDIAIAVAILIIAVLTVLIVRSIRNPIARLVKLVELMGTGNLGSRFGTREGKLRSGDEIARMGRSIDGLADDLRHLIGTVKERIMTLQDAGQGLSSMMEETGAAVIQINSNIGNTKGQLDEQSSAVGEVAAAIEELARNIESLSAMIGEQSALVAHSSASVEEMIANIESVAANAETAGVQSERNLSESAEGKARIDEVSDSVSAIVRYADNLGEAARIITEIADRTGLLAMNAAIEAAHAGDSGRGFAVVADEIRKLADQSTAQARDISQDLGRVAEAIQAVRGAADAAVLVFAANLERARGVGDSVREISGAMSEQREGGRQVLEALGKLRDITKEIERGSGEMATGDSAILGQVERLRNVNMVVVQNNEEITRGTKEINDAIAGTMELTARNAELITEVSMATNRFDIEIAPGKS